jgi:hypothetical protein
MKPGVNFLNIGFSIKFMEIKHFVISFEKLFGVEKFGNSGVAISFKFSEINPREGRTIII